jgi:hypothetical protein
MTQRQAKQDQQRANGVSDAASPFFGPAPEHIVTFNMNDVVDIAVLNVTTTDVLAKSNGTSPTPLILSYFCSHIFNEAIYETVVWCLYSN